VAPPTAPTAAAPEPLPSPLLVVGVGDSVTSAAHCDCQGFVGDYAGLLRRTYGVVVEQAEYGVDGGTTKSMLSLLSRSGPVRSAIVRADVVSVTIGANDLAPARSEYDAGRCGGSGDTACFGPAIAALARGLDADLTTIGQLTSGRRTQVLVNDYWNVFQDGAVAERAFGARFGRDSDAETRLADAAICAVARTHGDVCVDTYAPFEGTGDRDPTGLLGSDGDHPNARGHALIARAMLAAGLPALLGPLPPAPASRTTPGR
jgi:lysophospholipase L1-like esterase